jgi:tRNA(His) 5'-end guanylyltransferase
MPGIPIIARMDGKGFSKFTEGMDRPYDKRMQHCMIETTKNLIKESGACMGYTQSDEITLVWENLSLNEEMWFGGRVMKLASTLSARASVHFIMAVAKHMPEYLDRVPSLDARAWSVPNREKAANAFLWREKDATKNAITMAASVFYSTHELERVSSKRRIELLHQKGVRFSDYDATFRRGAFIQRVKTSAPISPEELALLPERHHARSCPGMVIERSTLEVIDMPPFGKVHNRSDVIFDYAKPVLIADVMREAEVANVA